MMEKLTNEKWVNLFRRDDGYVLASRKSSPDPEKVDAVAAAVMFGGDLILIKQNRPIIGKSEIDLPAGLVDEGEDPLHAIMREVKEETGLHTYLMHYETHPANRVYYSSAGLTDENYKMYWLVAPENQVLNPEPGIEVIPFNTKMNYKNKVFDCPLTTRAMYSITAYMAHMERRNANKSLELFLASSIK